MFSPNACPLNKNDLPAAAELANPDNAAKKKEKKEKHEYKINDEKQHVHSKLY